MATTLAITLLLILALISLSAFSCYLTYSGFVTGRTHIGWAVVGLYAILFLWFVFRWLDKTSFNSFLMLALLFFLPMLEGPLVFDLVTQALTPDPSRGMKLLKAYSAAEGKLSQNDLNGAIIEYEKVLAKDPRDTTARLRLAELCLQKKDYLKAAATYETLFAHARKASKGNRCSTLTTLSEIYAKHLDDPERARKCLQTIIEKYPNTKYSDFAAERLNNLPDSTKKA
jgi:tetratricopeptide (TPR) repeat protein